MEKWNYEVPESMLEQLLDTAQSDWNQTIMGYFNQLSDGIIGEKVIKVPNKFKKLINSLEYYDRESNEIANRFIVIFIDSNEDIIYVGENKLEILNY
jgi:hypothetical protein